MRRRRFYRKYSPLRHKEDASLNIVSLIDIMAVIIFFLLMYAVVFSKMVMLELTLPTPGDSASSSPPAVFDLRVVIYPDALGVSESKGGTVMRIANRGGRYDFGALSEVLRDVKTRHMEQKSATILSAADTRYDILVQTMDAVRTYPFYVGQQLQLAELFPDISVGDAPSN